MLFRSDHTCGTRASRWIQWDSNPQPLNTCVSEGAGSTTELCPFVAIVVAVVCSLWRREEFVVDGL